MINKNILCYITVTFWVSPAWQIAQFLGRMAALQLLGMGRPGALHEGPREAGIGQRRGCRDRVSWRPHPAAGSHLPAEGTAPPYAVAPFRIVASCPAPKKPHTPPHSTAGYRFKMNANLFERDKCGFI